MSAVCTCYYYYFSSTLLPLSTFVIMRVQLKEKLSRFPETFARREEWDGRFNLVCCLIMKLRNYNVRYITCARHFSLSFSLSVIPRNRELALCSWRVETIIISLARGTRAGEYYKFRRSLCINLFVMRILPVFQRRNKRNSTEHN